jgi:hypothetical protein
MPHPAVLPATRGLVVRDHHKAILVVRREQDCRGVGAVKFVEVEDSPADVGGVEAPRLAGLWDGHDR